jgi:membrane protein
VKALDQAYDAYQATIAWARRHSKIFDHLWLARARYNDVLGGRLAAAISYYGFFAAFSMGLLAYAVLGYVLSTENGFVSQVNQYLQTNLPWINSTSMVSQRSTLTIIGLVSLVLTGIGWVEALRSSQRAVWELEQHPGNVVIRRLVDLLILVGLSALLLLSLLTTWVLERMLSWVVGPEYGLLGGGVLRWSGPVLEFGVNVLLAAALLVGVPRLRMSARRLVPTAVLLGGGILVLNVVARLLIGRTERNPAYSLVTGAVGLLVYLYLLNQLIVFASAVAATSRHGRVVDLAAGTPQPPHEPGSEPSPAEAPDPPEPPASIRATDPR